MNFRNLSNLPSNKVFLCSYKNQTSQLQVLRIPNLTTGYFERVVFPEQHLLFEGEDQAHLEVYYSVCCDSIEMKQIPCISLRVDEML
ncbi:DUF1830 domain-containing protein [Capilliphycus salinus ALCB114379]|uniref:DUF1830 domain-containing protein n=1 Tax=Capilliphycus salinus TaxID=2768948 RepID=UPI0039A6B7C2